MFTLHPYESFYSLYAYWAQIKRKFLRPVLYETVSRWDIKTTLEQEVHKLKVSIIGLFNPSTRHVSRWDRLIQGFVNILLCNVAICLQLKVSGIWFLILWTRYSLRNKTNKLLFETSTNINVGNSRTYPSAAWIRSSGVALEGSSLLYTAKVNITPRRPVLSNGKGAVRTPFPEALARKTFSRSSYGNAAHSS